MILGSGLLTASGKTRLTLYTTKSGTFNPTIVASDTSGIVWDFGDGSATYTGGTPSHSYADSAQKTVRITFDDPALVTELKFQSMSMAGEWPLSSLVPFTALTHFYAYTNDSLNVSGDLLLLPSVLQYLRIEASLSTVHGYMSDLPPALREIRANDSHVEISGGSTAILATGLRVIFLYTNDLSQAQLDSILYRLYTDRATFTYATPAAVIGGTNPDPSGTYQDATPPTTGLEYAYKLVNDPDTEGFHKWTITY
ncbi:MAG: hypothetical protein KDE20_07560 [Caldilineaceae bacterium]|nr:hypothetical protein [Caldilineaceae bacterium]